MKVRWMAVLAAGMIWGAGCDRGPEKVEHPEGEKAWEMAHSEEVDDAAVVARVDGVAITKGDVAVAWAEQPALEADEIVDALVTREILAGEARRRGYHERPEVSFARKQGMVKALLADRIEGKGKSDGEERNAEIERVAGQRRTPEGLRASHLVILVPDEIDGERLDRATRETKFERARGWIDEAATVLEEEETLSDDDLRQMAEHLNADVLPEGYEAVVNEHLRFPRAGEEYRRESLPEGWVSVLSEFAEGAEAVADHERRGELSDPVRTELGWHLIRVLDAMEAREADREALEAFVERRLMARAASERLQAKMEDRWAADSVVELYPDRLGSSLAE